ncbi:hypothetical protein HRG_004190 [Hirsutella rhossiliensis]|uniref:Hydrophobin n=1 Tax=Hirsutella rhossiliensis TaxID=111463 RepID=A0A9P8N2Z7_9HYPO|nr:uncharacterized protein HRG_04190 [Hirsutella rhossiliensis]KAH0963762.1 hypothetical protein HRG_04190 [Hirsutella rhossiliensis]
MKYTAAFSVLALAATAIAVPTELEARGGPGNGGGSGGGGTTCSASGQKQVCCTGLLNCLVAVVGENCNNSAYCCTTDAPAVRMISTSSNVRELVAASPG